MKDLPTTAARRSVRLGLPVFLALMPFLTGCASGIAVPVILAGTYALADIMYLPLRSIVGTVLLNIINGV